MEETMVKKLENKGGGKKKESRGDGVAGEAANTGHHGEERRMLGIDHRAGA